MQFEENAQNSPYLLFLETRTTHSQSFSCPLVVFWVETPKEIKNKLDLIVSNQTGIESNMTKQWNGGQIAALFREDGFDSTANPTNAAPADIHNLPLSDLISCKEHIHTLTVFTPKSSDLPCSGMLGISHLIRYYIYIEQEVFLRAIMRTSMWARMLTHAPWCASWKQ